MDVKNSPILSCFGLVALFVGIAIIGYVMNGIVLSFLWEWFVVPLFGVSRLGIAQAIGISIIVGFLTNRGSSDEKKNKTSAEIAGSVIAYTLGAPLMVLFTGYVVHSFI